MLKGQAASPLIAGGCQGNEERSRQAAGLACPSDGVGTKARAGRPAFSFLQQAVSPLLEAFPAQGSLSPGQAAPFHVPSHLICKLGNSVSSSVEPVLPESKGCVRNRRISWRLFSFFSFFLSTSPVLPTLRNK